MFTSNQTDDNEADDDDDDDDGTKNNMSPPGRGGGRHDWSLHISPKLYYGVPVYANKNNFV